MCAALYGFSRTALGSLPLPFALAPIGAPGCMLLCSTEAIGGRTASANGDASFVLTVPNLPSLSGVTLYNQWLTIDTSSTPSRISASNATESVLGH